MAENNSPLDIYEIQKTIGKGGGGTVYKALHKRLQKEVVIKQIHDSVREEERRNEVDVLKNLRHSYIPAVLDYFTIDGVSYTVMDYIEGESFQSLLDRGVKFKESQVIKYGKQLCEAVEYLHSRDIPVIHGDIKPDNIMLKPDDDICLIDFNISGISEGSTAYTTGFTKGYSAPEQEEAFYRIVEELKKKRGTAATAANVQTGSGNPGSDETEVLSAGVSDETEVLGGNSTDSDATEVLGGAVVDSDATEVLGSASSYDPDATEVLDAGVSAGQPSSLKGEIHGGTNDFSELPKIPIDKRSDVYSIGATLFHLYTGTRLDKADKKVLKAGTSEGYLYILNKALQENPRNRFVSAGEMLKALNSIHQKEKAYRSMVIRQSIVRIVLLFGIVAGAGLISLGLQKKQEEKEALYASYIEQMASYDPAGSEEGFEEIYQNAVGLKPDAIDAYEQKAFFLYKRKAYEDTVAYVDEALQNSSVYETERVAGLYYVSGNAHYALDEYKEAADDFRNALKYDAKNPDINGDYAIALAKTGDLSGAADAAAKAEEYGIADAHLYLTRGEIEFAKGNYDEAEKYLRDCIRLTDDDYRKMCAYITCGKALTAGGGQEDLDKGIEFLNSGLSDVGIEYKGYLMGLLAETYIQAYSLTEEEKYSEGAIGSLAEMIESGWASYSTYNNIVILCTNTGRYDDAAKYIGLMEERYQDNYNVYKRKAFLELEVQKTKSEKERDFSKFKEFYEEAERLFKEQAGDKQDPEMDLLRDDLQVLKDTHWL